MGASGQTTLDFGAFPGVSDASVAVTGQAAIIAGSLVEAWIFPAVTTDHSADEHLAESFRVMAGNIAVGTGFTIYGMGTGPVYSLPSPDVVTDARTPGKGSQFTAPDAGGILNLIYGKWNIGWVWV